MSVCNNEVQEPEPTAQHMVLMKLCDTGTGHTSINAKQFGQSSHSPIKPAPEDHQKSYQCNH